MDTAVLGAGTHELYRDLLYPGGIPNGVPALGVSNTPMPDPIGVTLPGVASGPASVRIR